MGCLIEELYSSNAVDLIRDLYYDDPSAKYSFYNAFGHKIIQSQNKILISKPLDILLFICSTAKFATSEHECQMVSVMIYKRLKEKNPLPYMLDDRGIDLAEKIFISLSFFYPALNRRWERGGPHPSFYRGISKQIFSQEQNEDFVRNFEKWEVFFQEFFV